MLYLVGFVNEKEAIVNYLTLFVYAEADDDPGAREPEEPDDGGE